MKRSRTESSSSPTCSVISNTSTTTIITPPPRCLQSFRVLYVDRAETNSKERSKNLERATNRHLPGGFASFDIVRDGLEAIHLANKVEYDIIFVSSELRLVRAYNVSSCLRECLVDCPMVLITVAKANAQEISDASANGFDAILTEPFMGDAVAKIIRKLCIGQPEGQDSLSFAPDKVPTIVARPHKAKSFINIQPRAPGDSGKS